MQKKEKNKNKMNHNYRWKNENVKNEKVLVKNSFKKEIKKNIKKIPIVKVNVSHITIIKIF